MHWLSRLSVKIYADGADKARMLELYARPYISGLTTNPTLMRRAGVGNYREFAREVLATVRSKPISFEVLADDSGAMERQALEIASWADNVYVKIPVTNTRGESSASLVKRLVGRGVRVNVTAVTTLAQVRAVAEVLDPQVPSCVSIFAGRIADTGVDPMPVIAQAVRVLEPNRQAQIVWASPREVLNIFQADAVGCQVITVTSDILPRLELIGRDLTEYSLATVKMFYDDASAAGFSL